MKIKVDWAKCTGLGICESFAPDVFEVDETGALVLHTTEIERGQREAVERAVLGCPTEALSLEA